MVAEGSHPIIGGDFDIYLRENHLFFVKEACAADDVAPKFFLHIVPVNADNPRYEPCDTAPQEPQRRKYDTHLYGLRHLVENGFCKFKEWRGICDPILQETSSYLANCQIRAIIIWANVI